MKKRAASEEEKILFRKSVEKAGPLVIRDVKAKKPRPKIKSTGLDGHTAARLKRGAQNPEMKLDLHGQSEESAHRALQGFLQAALAGEARLVLVITGQSGVLKKMVPRWLNRPDFAALITGTETAHVRHGGAGALYVYLRK